MSRPASLIRIRPSCGSRFSAMFELPHHLHPADDAVLVALGRLDHLLEHAVDAEAHQQLPLHRLDVDVAGPLLGGAEEQRVHQPDDRRLVVGVEEVLRLLQLVGQALEVLGLHLAHQLLGLVQCPVVDPVDGVDDHRGHRDVGRDVALEQHPGVVEHRGVQRVGHRQGHRLAVHRQREDQRLLGEVDRHLPGPARRRPRRARCGRGRAGRAAAASAWATSSTVTDLPATRISPSRPPSSAWTRSASSSAASLSPARARSISPRGGRTSEAAGGRGDGWI